MLWGDNDWLWALQQCCCLPLCQGRQQCSYHFNEKRLCLILLTALNTKIYALFQSQGRLAVSSALQYASPDSCDEMINGITINVLKLRMLLLEIGYSAFNLYIQQHITEIVQEIGCLGWPKFWYFGHWVTKMLKSSHSGVTKFGGYHFHMTPVQLSKLNHMITTDPWLASIRG